MARTDTLGHFLTDVADAIREKTGDSDPITAEDFDTEIESIETGGGKYKPKYISFQGYTGSDLTYETQNLDTSLITTMSYMFFNCGSLTTLDTSGFDTSSVTTMQNMFGSCARLTSANFDNFNLTNVVHIGGFLQGCTRLTSVSMKPTNNKPTTTITLTAMFSGCSSLTSVDIRLDLTGSNNDVYTEMFDGCTSLQELDLSGITSNKMYNTRRMFRNCTSLTKIDMRNFDFSNPPSLTYITDMFGATASNGVPDNCLIIMKDATAKSFITTNFTRLTNVKTAAEYEASQT